MYLDREDQVGLTIADEENHKNDDEIRKLIYKMKREGASIPSRSQPTVPNYLDQLLNTATCRRLRRVLGYSWQMCVVYQYGHTFKTTKAIDTHG